MKPWLGFLLLVPTALLAAENHFPQPVRVGDLIGQKLIGATEAQPLLGRVEAIDRLPSGDLAVRIATASLLSSRSVDVPIDAISFLGPQLALTGLTQAQLDALPAATPSPLAPSPLAPSPLAPDAVIRVGLVKPFH